MTMNPIYFEVTDTSINDQLLKQQLRHDACGGFVCFEGWVRNHNENKEVTGLFYESYTELALLEGQRIVQQALNDFDIEAAYCVHRVGELAIGDMAVWVGVSSAHRDAAFLACRFIIDAIKQDVPIWKQERYKGEDMASWLLR